RCRSGRLGGGRLGESDARETDSNGCGRRNGFDGSGHTSAPCIGVVLATPHKSRVAALNLAPTYRSTNVHGGARARDHPRSLWKCSSNPRVELSCPSSGACPSTFGKSAFASCLPSSTPHWSYELMPQIVPCTNTLCS